MQTTLCTRPFHVPCLSLNNPLVEQPVDNGFFMPAPAFLLTCNLTLPGAPCSRASCRLPNFSSPWGRNMTRPCRIALRNRSSWEPFFQNDFAGHAIRVNHRHNPVAPFPFRLFVSPGHRFYSNEPGFFQVYYGIVFQRLGRFSFSLCTGKLTQQANALPRALHGSPLQQLRLPLAICFDKAVKIGVTAVVYIISAI